MQIAKLRMAIAAIGHEEGNQRTNSLDIGTIDYRAAVTRAVD
jgi:hypothetical protein